MADKIIEIFDQDTNTYIPVKFHDNGDGTYSEVVSVEGAGGGGGDPVGYTADSDPVNGKITLEPVGSSGFIELISPEGVRIGLDPDVTTELKTEATANRSITFPDASGRLATEAYVDSAVGGGGGGTIIHSFDATATQASNYTISGLDLETDKVYFLDIYFPYASGMACHVNINGGTSDNPGSFKGARMDGTTITHLSSTPTIYNGNSTTTLARLVFMLGGGLHDGVVAGVEVYNAGVSKITGVLDYGEAFTDPATNLTSINLTRGSGNRFPAGTRIVLSKPF